MHPVLPQAMAHFPIKARQVGQFRIGLVVTRQKRHCRAPVPGKRADLVNPVRPVAAAAEQTHDDQLRLRQHRLDVKIDGIVMAQMQQVGEP